VTNDIITVKQHVVKLLILNKNDTLAP